MSNLTLPSPFPAATHTVDNVATDFGDVDLFALDPALQGALDREGGGWAEAEVAAFGSLAGSAVHLERGALANRYPPELDTHDRFGRRIDLVRFHPAYHELMDTAISHGLHSSPWTDPRPGAHVARAAKLYLHAQVEAGHGCPITMTFAAIPTLRTTPALAAEWEPKLTARIYDPRNVPASAKAGLTIGMGMTEKQGGSDVRQNSTRALPLSAATGPGTAYELVGHKFFLSAPMCDLFLVLAQAPGGLSCFLVPRFRPEGSKNPLELVRLKRKMGNQSNASSEVELRGCLGIMVGAEGRGVRTIIEMVALTRFDCVVGSSGAMRMAASQALHHATTRRAFGKRLVEQPLMKNVLADLALEAEAALTLALRLARALDQRGSDRREDLFVRIGAPIAKYWVCKRTPQHAYEAMECIGGSGVMEDCMLPRLYREAPINAIWEGSGNVQCLDVLRAMAKSPEVVDALFAELALARGQNAHFDRSLAELGDELGARRSGADLADLELSARGLVDRLALALEASLLVRHAPAFVADAFCASRLGARGHHNYGALPRGSDVDALLQRAWPLLG
jgi:putative acyl-CoA dehydrogenase